MSKLLPSLLVAVVLTSSGAAIAASGTTIGPSNASRCFEESRFALSASSLEYCDDAIKTGDLTRRDLAATYSNRGIIHASLGQYQSALADHNRAIELMPSLAEAYINRGNVHYHLRDFEAALADYDVAASMGASPLHTAYLNKGLTLLKLKEKDEARIAFQKALELAPQSKKIKRQLELLEEM